MQALVLAAGRGDRLRPLTDTTPKPLLCDSRESLLERHLRRLKQAGATRVVINLGWLGEQIVEQIGSGDQFGLNVIYSPEGYPTLDTGGAIVRALPLLGDEPFFVVNADVWTDFDFAKGVEQAGASEACLWLAENPAYRDAGDFALVDGGITNVGEPTFTFSGIAHYAPAFFDGLTDGRFSVVPHLRVAADEGRVAGQMLGAHWFDVGTSERLQALREFVDQRA